MLKLATFFFASHVFGSTDVLSDDITNSLSGLSTDAKSNLRVVKPDVVQLVLPPTPRITNILFNESGEASVTLTLGESARIVLYENASTGFMWVPEGEVPDCIRFVESNSLSRCTPSDIIVCGRGSDQEFIYKAVNSGSGTLLLKSVRHKDHKSEIRRTLHVTVLEGLNPAEVVEPVQPPVLLPPTTDIEFNETGESSIILSLSELARIVVYQNGSTGFRWVVDGEVPDCLGFVDSNCLWDNVPGGELICGRGSNQEFIYEAKKAGSGTLRLRYVRGDREEIDRRTLHVTVLDIPVVLTKRPESVQLFLNAEGIQSVKLSVGSDLTVNFYENRYTEHIWELEGDVPEIVGFTFSTYDIPCPEDQGMIDPKGYRAASHYMAVQVGTGRLTFKKLHRTEGGWDETQRVSVDITVTA